MIRQNIEKFFEVIDLKLIPPIFILLFEALILEYECDKATKNIYSYKCDRSSEELNYTLVKNQDIIKVYDKYEMIDSFNIKDTQTNDKHLVKYLINRLFYTENNFNMKCNKNLLMIYSGNNLADEVYELKKEPENFNDFFNSEILEKYETIDTKHLKMFIYLIMYGYLSDHTIYLYKRSLIILCKDGSLDFFNIDLSSFLDIHIPLERNKYLGNIKSYSFLIGYSTNKEKTMKIYNTNKFKNMFSDFLNYGINKDIRKLIKEKKYLEIIDLIDKEDSNKIFKLIEDEKILEEIKKNVEFND